MAVMDGGRVTMGEATVSTAAGVLGQVAICQSAAAAAARNSPAAPGLRLSCGQLRSQNVAAGDLFVDAVAPDAQLRVNLANTGEHIIAGDPNLTSVASKLSADVRRGYAIGIKVGAMRGGLDPAYVAWITQGMSSQDAQGVALALSGVARGGTYLQATSYPKATTKAVNPTGASSGVPTAVYVGGGIVLAVGIGAAIYKFVL